MSQQYTFSVAGAGHFPFDMLRYDECYPWDTVDAMKLQYPVNWAGERKPIGETQREIKLVSNRCPTYDRWASFGWIITDFNGMPDVSNMTVG